MMPGGFIAHGRSQKNQEHRAIEKSNSAVTAMLMLINSAPSGNEQSLAHEDFVVGRLLNVNAIVIQQITVDFSSHEYF